ncbi:tigger transposable element-derived protein 4-like [Pecten maximus]|uniref:tigger transposable element-derived protein 4-like n=1 Tax=Pecten maximus TaxID=6579 RepID=UPI001458DDBB|nr:tigger transposable element-derived protein 4-like [Pecten maximus]
MDQGLIYNLKYRYRTRLIKRYLDNLEKKRETEVNVLIAIHTVYSAWQELTKDCIHNCFFESWIPSVGPHTDVDIGDTSDDEDDLPLSCFLQWNSVPKDRDMSLHEYVAIDDSVTTSHGLDDDEIIACVANKNGTGDSSDDDSIDCIEPVKTETAVQCVETLRRYICQTENTPQELFSNLSAFEAYFEKVSVKKQFKITDWFEKM